MLVFLICLIPFIIPFIVKHFFPKKVSWKELILTVFISCGMASIIYYTSLYSEMKDIELLSGYVTDKDRKQVSCRHSYNCNCITTRVGKTTSTRCQTCYRHSYDIKWTVYTTLGDYDITTKDSQGLLEPSHWTTAYPKQPVAKEHEYDNYVKGNSDSLFNLKKYTNFKDIPTYPTVTGYYDVNRVISEFKTGSLSNELNDMLSTVGANKQVNIVLVITKKDIEYAYKLKSSMLGGKKNDVVIVLGTDDGVKLKYVNAFGWSKNELVYISLRDDLMKNNSLTNIVPIIEKNINAYYVRRDMKDFEYLKDTIEPSTSTIVWSLVLGLFFSGLFSFLSVRYDII